MSAGHASELTGRVPLTRSRTARIDRGRVADALRDAYRWQKYMPRSRVIRFSVGWALQQVVDSQLRCSRQPSVYDLATAGDGIYSELLPYLDALTISVEQYASAVDEHAEVATRLKERYEEAHLGFEYGWGVEQLTALFLYYAVRTLKPRVVVETGVANGHSSFFILAALQRNGDGVLHSFDINPAAGVLVDDRTRWELHVSTSADPEAELRDTLRGLGEVDLFFHDSDHRYPTQMFEYETAWPFMAARGLMVSDDVNDTLAFVDFTHNVQRKPCLLLDHRKVIGAIRV